MPVRNHPRSTCTYKIGKTETFRLSSSKLLGDCGQNMQNIEKSMRRLYIPDDDRVFVQVDQSGAEALIVSYLSRPGQLRDLFLYGIKPHVFVALRMFPKQLARKKPELAAAIAEAFNTPIKDLKALPRWKEIDTLIKDSDNWAATERYYYLAKQICHSSNYAITPPALQINILEKSGGKISISLDDAKLFLELYTRTLFPEIPSWWSDVDAQVEQHRILRNLFGFPRIITEPLTDKTKKELYAFIPQSTVGTITNIAVTRMYQFIKEHKLKWDLLANTHDSYMIQCPESESLECAKKMKEVIEMDLVSPRGEPFKMRSEAQVGKNWAPWKKDKNEDGLVEVKI